MAVLGCALVGCGQKGKLYLPNQKKQVPPATQSNSPPQPDTQTQSLPAPDAR
ncbi:MAG TPA: lipoprotein [Steroidobacteraceae bacterium]|jgi:predicted small lipoprotein YifL|nr:lipoprotein [Steroidobacteraceae bacterium]